MLYLTRRLGERIFIEGASGDTVIILVKSFGENSVSLGFQAPKETKINREELFLKKIADEQ